MRTSLSYLCILALGCGTTNTQELDAATSPDAVTADAPPTPGDSGSGDAATDARVTPDAPRPVCTPMDADGIGSCELILGIAWDGAACVTLSGCSCEGSDCSRLFSTETACQAAYSGCGTE